MVNQVRAWPGALVRVMAILRGPRSCGLIGSCRMVWVGWWAGGGELGGGVFGFPSLSLRDRVQQQGPGWHVGVGGCGAFPQVGPVPGAVGGVDADGLEELP